MFVLEGADLHPGFQASRDTGVSQLILQGLRISGRIEYPYLDHISCI